MLYNSAMQWSSLYRQPLFFTKCLPFLKCRISVSFKVLFVLISLYSSPFLSDAITSIYLCTAASPPSLTLYKILTGLISQKHHKTDVFDIYAVMDYISENYSENINVSNIASAFNFSRSYFTTLFTRQCGSSPYVYLQQYRLTAAKELLTSTNLSIDEVAYKCGFNSTSAFIRTFREHEKISPLAYRKKCTRKEQT